MDLPTLIRMANQIADFYEFSSDPGQAANDVAMHLKRFWAPRMRQQLGAHLADSETSELKDLVRQAFDTAALAH